MLKKIFHRSLAVLFPLAILFLPKLVLADGGMIVPQERYNLFYIGIEGGAAIATDVVLAPDWDQLQIQRSWITPAGSSLEALTRIGSAGFGGVRVGWNINPNLSTDLSYNFTGNFENIRSFTVIGQATTGNPVGERYKFTGINANTFLVNFNLHPCTAWAGITPFVSVGVGASINKIGNLVNNLLLEPGAAQTFELHVNGDTATHFAWQAGVGLNYMLTDQVGVNVGYRYMDFGTFATGNAAFERISNAHFTIQQFKAKHVAANEVYLGLTYGFSL
jgi:opacity protein-like surface antigen